MQRPACLASAFTRVPAGHLHPRARPSFLQVVLTAFAVTCGIVAALTVLALFMPWDFTRCGRTLAAASVVVFVVLLISMLFGFFYVSCWYVVALRTRRSSSGAAPPVGTLASLCSSVSKPAAVRAGGMLCFQASLGFCLRHSWCSIFS